MVARAARLFPRVAALPVAAAWAGLRPWLPDHLPGDRAVARGAGALARDRPRGRRRRARARHRPAASRSCYCGEAPVVDPAPFDPDRFAGA